MKDACLWIGLGLVGWGCCELSRPLALIVLGSLVLIGGVYGCLQRSVK